MLHKPLRKFLKILMLSFPPRIKYGINFSENPVKSRIWIPDQVRFDGLLEGPLNNKQEKSNMASASARHILVATEEECSELKEKIAGGADFAELAEAHSKCPSGAEGGALGEFGPGQMVKEFDEVVFSAELNKVQGPVKTQFGYHLLEVTSRRD